MTKHKNRHVVRKKRTNYVELIRRFLNLQTCLFVLEPDYANIEIETGLMSQSLFKAYPSFAFSTFLAIKNVVITITPITATAEYKTNIHSETKIFEFR